MFADIQAAIRRIPKGKVATYGQVAEAAGYPGAARQVVWALRAARGDIPWYRVVGSKGAILLTGQSALEQRLRLETEGIAFRGARIDMDAHAFAFPKKSKRRRHA